MSTKKKKEDKEKEKAARKAAGLPPMEDQPEDDGEGSEGAAPSQPG